MRVTRKKQKVIVSKLGNGQCFVLNDDIWMVGHCDATELPTIRLVDGYVRWLPEGSGMVVEPIEMEIWEA